jgi:hypothetical protein
VPFLDLAQSWDNLLGWLALRSYLLMRAKQPQSRVNAEIVLSAAGKTSLGLTVYSSPHHPIVAQAGH